MLRLKIPLGPEEWDEEKEEFIEPKCKILELEHSLVSLQKWESKWCKPFLHTNELTYEETLDYIKCMTKTQNVDPDVYNFLTESHVKEIKEYIASPMTATTFSDDKSGKKNREIITAEIIYYWMVALQIPESYRKWHLNQLLTLIRVCNIKNEPPKQKNKSDIMRSNAALNAARRKKLNTRG
jgi:hypothetical protein